jgi:hypothetical protein
MLQNIKFILNKGRLQPVKCITGKYSFELQFTATEAVTEPFFNDSVSTDQQPKLFSMGRL